MRWLVILCLGVLAGCRGDETLTGYGAAERVWVLQSIDGTAFSAHAELAFPEAGKIAGRGPCNSFSAEQSSPYPWFEAGGIHATRMACPELEQEAVFFKALGAMSLSEVGPEILILSTDTGREMIFKPAE